VYKQWQLKSRSQKFKRYGTAAKAEVPNLGYMYRYGYICLSEGVHLRLAIEGKYIFTYLHLQIFIDISVNIIFKNRYMLIVKYIYD